MSVFARVGKPAVNFTRSCAVTRLLTLGALNAVHAATPGGTIRFEKTGFSSMNTQLVRGITLHFSNQTGEPLQLRVVTWRGVAVDELNLPAHGGTVAWKPARDGVYVFYDVRNTSSRGGDPRHCRGLLRRIPIQWVPRSVAGDSSRFDDSGSCITSPRR